MPKSTFRRFSSLRRAACALQSVLALLAFLTLAITRVTPAAEAPAPALPSAAPVDAQKKLSLMIISDSTAAEYDASMVIRGWGQFLPEQLPKNITVMNRARPGRSAKSFMEEGSWKDALREKPDFAIIQFGHNDAVKVKELGEKAAVREFKKYLGGYVDTARKAGIQPILMTPTATRTFKAEDGPTSDDLTAFVEAVRSVADQRHVPLIDLHAQCQQLYNALGKDKTAYLDSLPGDRVHFNELGAKAVSQIIARDLTVIDTRFSLKPLTPYEIKMLQIPVPK